MSKNSQRNKDRLVNFSETGDIGIMFGQASYATLTSGERRAYRAYLQAGLLRPSKLLAGPITAYEDMRDLRQARTASQLARRQA